MGVGEITRGFLRAYSLARAGNTRLCQRLTVTCRTLSPGSDVRTLQEKRYSFVPKTYQISHGINRTASMVDIDGVVFRRHFAVDKDHRNGSFRQGSVHIFASLVAGHNDHAVHAAPTDHREDRKSTRLNSSHYCASRMPSSA